MNVRTLCLAILSCGDSTGYEIRKLVTDGHFSHFVDASFGSIYPALNKMESEGLVVSNEKQQEGKPNAKVYSICEKGHLAFLNALSEPAQKDIFKSEFLLLAMCAELMEPHHVSRALDRQIAHIENELALIAKGMKEINKDAAQWVADYGRECLGHGLAYIRKNRMRLEAIAGTGRHKGPQNSTIPLPIAAE